MPQPHSSGSASSERQRKPKLTLAQRLVRAGLTFILLGTVAAMLPEAGTVLADTQQCTGSSQDYYRLTTDSTGATDPSPVGPFANSDKFKLYFFVSQTASGPWEAFTPASGAKTNATGSFNGNRFDGTAKNTGSSNVTGAVTATAPGVSVTESFTVAPTIKFQVTPSTGTVPRNGTEDFTAQISTDGGTTYSSVAADWALKGNGVHLNITGNPTNTPTVTVTDTGNGSNTHNTLTATLHSNSAYTATATVTGS